MKVLKLGSIGMPLWFKLCIVIIFGSFWLIPISISTPFIYYDRYLLTFILTFCFMYSYFCLFLITQYRLTERKRNDFYINMSVRKLVFFLLSVLMISLLIGDTLRFLAPVTADLLASEFAIHEYKAIKVEPYARTFRQLSKLHVIDLNGNDHSFVIKNEMLDKLQLQENEKMIARGRNCIAGFVIDDINGVPRP